MKRFIRTEHEIAAPSEKVWATIAKGDGVETWLPIIKSSKLEGGNRRFCEMHEGGKLEETILASEGTKTFMYSIDKQEAFPAKEIVGTMKVEALSADKTKLFWDVEMEVENDEVFAELKKNIEGVYQMSAAKLSEIA
ncbi:MAG: SRPBCC family protein [Bacteroidia bacterium]|nr:SRPBCC family protein [Bacteroidia bacterium]